MNPNNPKGFLFTPNGEVIEFDDTRKLPLPHALGNYMYFQSKWRICVRIRKGDIFAKWDDLKPEEVPKVLRLKLLILV